jgi:hypothetical protein
VAIVFHADRAVALPEQDGEVHQIGLVVGVGVPVPFEVAEPSPAVVVSAVAGPRPEALPDEVRDEQGHAAGAEVNGGRLHGGPEVVARGHVVDGVVHEHRVELTAEPERPHVRLDVVAFGVDRPAEREHPRRQVGERHVEVALQM